MSEIDIIIGQYTQTILELSARCANLALINARAQTQLENLRNPTAPAADENKA